MKILLSVIFLFFSGVLFPQSAESVLSSLQSKFNSINDLSADIFQNLDERNGLSGKMFFKRENNLRIEFPNQILVADGKTAWNYNKKEKKLIISDYEETNSGLLSINYLVYQYPSECDLTLSKEGSNQVLQLNPKSRKNNPGIIKLYINKDNLIDKAVIQKNGSARTEVKISNYKINQNISAANFSFTAPEGTTVIDLRE